MFMMTVGNILSTNLHSTLPYSDRMIKKSASHLGSFGKYFTFKSVFFFIAALDINGVDMV
jgi:hypothetical protein